MRFLTGWKNLPKRRRPAPLLYNSKGRYLSDTSLQLVLKGLTEFCRFAAKESKNIFYGGVYCAAVGGFAALRMRRALYGYVGENTSHEAKCASSASAQSEVQKL